MKTPAAVATDTDAPSMGRRSWQSRIKGKSKKQISEMMRRIAQQPRPNRRKLDKTRKTTPRRKVLITS